VAVRRATPIAAALAAFLLSLLVAVPIAHGAGATAYPRVIPRVTFILPFEPGIEVDITQGWNSTYSHTGLAAFAYDFSLAEGTPVTAAAAGVVSYVHGGETRCGGPALLNNANLVVIDHADGTATLYGHLSAVTVKVGDAVDAGERICAAGSTGFTGCESHLHFARQAQGGEVTQSQAIYFDGAPKREFLAGDIVSRTGVCIHCQGVSAVELDASAQFVPKDEARTPNSAEVAPARLWPGSPYLPFYPGGDMPTNGWTPPRSGALPRRRRRPIAAGRAPSRMITA